MRIVESVLSPKPENANVKSSVLWSERNVRSLKMVPPPPEAAKRSSTLSNVLEGTMNFVRKNVLSVNTLSLFAGITCMVAVVLAVWAIYMFKEQKAKMRNLQNMVVDMSLSEAKQRNGGVSNLNKPTPMVKNEPDVPKQPRKVIDTTPSFPLVSSFMGNMAKQDLLLSAQTMEKIPDEMEQMDELRKVQEEVAKLLTNPFNIVMSAMPEIEKPTSTVTIEEITEIEKQSVKEMTGMVDGVTEQRKRFENMLNGYTSQMKEGKTNDYEQYDIDGEDDDDFLKDIELYTQQEKSMQEDMEQLQNDLQMMSS